jgi:hypothetical protein
MLKYLGQSGRYDVANGKDMNNKYKETPKVDWHCREYGRIVKLNNTNLKN